MGITGTDVTKKAAYMILTDDNFASIEAAVEEGRGVFANLTKFIVSILPTNGGVALTLLVAIIAGITLPLLPTQLLWLNLVTAVFLGLSLAFEPKESDIMQHPPRDPKLPLFTFTLLIRTGLVTLASTAGAFGVFAWERGVAGADLEETRTAVVNVIVMAQIFYLLKCRSRTRSMFSIDLFSNPWLICRHRRNLASATRIRLSAANESASSHSPRADRSRALYHWHRRADFRCGRVGEMAALPNTTAVTVDLAQLWSSH